MPRPFAFLTTNLPSYLPRYLPIIRTLGRYSVYVQRRKSFPARVSKKLLSFCHNVSNAWMGRCDEMSLTGQSFRHGPWPSSLPSHLFRCLFFFFLFIRSLFFPPPLSPPCMPGSMAMPRLARALECFERRTLPSLGAPIRLFGSTSVYNMLLCGHGQMSQSHELTPPRTQEPHNKSMFAAPHSGALCAAMGDGRGVSLQWRKWDFFPFHYVHAVQVLYGLA